MTTRGAGVVIGVIDDAVDTRHPEFHGRVLEGYNAGTESGGPLPEGWEPHGTKCAGVALAGGRVVTGLAPEALLMPVRVPSLSRVVGDPAEARAIRWAAGHGADVICCAWGPPRLTRESGKLPGHTRAAIEWAVRHGRQGKGSVIVMAAGNEGCNLALNGYASHAGVIAVGACNSRGRRPAYSNWGDALWCVFPSNDPDDPACARDTVPTTTAVGSFLLGETFYTDEFGLTSAACAGVAGLCALILSANPSLSWRQVKEVVRASCRRVDPPEGRYDATGHSPLHGYGRPDAARAVSIARQSLRRAGGVQTRITRGLSAVRKTATPSV